MLKNKLLFTIIMFLLFSACKKEKEAQSETHYYYEAVESVYATMSGDSEKQFLSTQIKPYGDTVRIGFPRYYPANTENEIDLTKVNLHLNLNKGVEFYTSHSESDVIDLSVPYRFKTINKESSVKEIVVVADYISEFEIETGVNITYLFYMPKFLGEERRLYFNRDDVKLISELGFDHIRLAIEEVEYWDEDGKVIQSSSDLLHDIIKWCDEFDVKVIIDLHSTRNHVHTNRENELFTDPGGLQYFINLWMMFSEELSEYPNSLVAYELLNEPASSSAQMWNYVVKETVKAIREKEPERVIIINPCHVTNDQYTKVMYSELEIPQNDRNIWMTIHFYDPFLLTGYGFQSTTYGRTDIPISYPGRLIEDEYINLLPPTWQSTGQRTYDKEVLKSMMLEGINKSKELNVKVFLGEFGSLNTLPSRARRNWYEDVVSICKEFGLPYTHFDYKGGGYSLVNMNNEVSHPDLVNILTK